LVFGAIARLTLARQSETVRPDNRLWVMGMKRIVMAAMVTTVAGLLLQGETAQAQTAASGARTAQASQPAATDASAQRRPLRRVPIYRPDHWEPDVILDTIRDQMRCGPAPRPMCRNTGRAAR